jgi:hypothetical protein
MEIIWTVLDLKLVELSGPKEGEYLKDDINKLETNSNKESIGCLCRDINKLLYLFIRRVIKMTIAISLSRNITVINYTKNVIQYFSVKVNSIRRRNYYGSSV